jgi:hypothetical protein
MRHLQRALASVAAALAAALASLPALIAQTPTQPSPPRVSVSGVIFGNYQYHLSGQSKDFNQFLLDRAYVNVRASIGDRTSIRITSDVFQSGDQNGWTIRAKYAYLQYDLVKDTAWTTAVRAGMLHNVMVEQVEQFWPRFLSPVALERSGGFASADVGAAALVTLPARIGEVYAHVVNGPGYTRRETDRFKDYAVRVSLTPLAGRVSGPFSTLTISPWIYEGATASRFVRGAGGGVIAPVGEGLSRDRYGVIAGVRDPRITIAGEVARMRTVTDDTVRSGTTLTRIVMDARANVLSAFGTIRPLAFVSSNGRSRFGVIARYDDVESNTAANDRFHFLIAGVLFDVNRSSTLALDYQEQLANSGAPALPSPGAFRTLFLHAVVSF